MRYPQFTTLLELEQVATRVRHVRTRGLPGLLQGKSTARRLIRSEGGVSRVEVNRAVKIRMERRLIFLRTDVRVEFILDELVLHQLGGVSAEQIRELLWIRRITNGHNSTIRLLPLYAGLDHHHVQPFTVIDHAPSERGDRMVLFEHDNPVFNDGIITDPDSVAAWEKRFAYYERQTEDVGFTLNVINRRLAELGWSDDDADTELIRTE